MFDLFSMRTGDTVRVPIHPKVRGTGWETGKVVYIHPARRFFSVEIIMASGATVRESYCAYGPLDDKELPVRKKTGVDGSLKRA